MKYIYTVTYLKGCTPIEKTFKTIKVALSFKDSVYGESISIAQRGIKLIPAPKYLISNFLKN